MSNSYLQWLAEQILQISEKISKVRFAKTIYYTHKALVKKGLSDTDALKFIRMPLGPVPVGFMQLSKDPKIRVEYGKNGLAYNTQNYLLAGNAGDISNEQREVISSVLKSLERIPTSTLVGFSHKEPSWLKHENGQEYFIDQEDLKRVLRVPPIKQMTESRDAELLQAHLLSGMLKEIVEESTLLEYPADEE